MLKPAEVLAKVRAKRPFVDHLMQMNARYQADAGDRLAAAVTYYWFLSLFPILLIAVFFVNQALGGDAGRQVTDGLKDYLGPATASAVGKVVQDSAGKAGLIGLAGVLLAGLGWVDALREAIRSMWHHERTGGNLVTRKVADIVALVGLFAVIGGSVVVSGAATAASDSVLTFLGLSPKSTTAEVLTISLSYVVGALIDVAIFLFLFVRLAKVATPVRSILRGVLFGAVGFEVLKFFAAFYIGRTTSKGEATYGTFAVVVGLLVFLNLVSRLVMYTAAFMVTAPYDGDTLPSGTSGAPTPAPARFNGRVEQMERSWESKKVVATQREVPAQPMATAAGPAPGLRGAEKVQLAATVTAAAGGALLAAVGLYAVRTLQGLARR